MKKDFLKAKLVLEDGSIFYGNSFGFNKSTSGEVVFNTGMVGYPETMTDPSYAGQILTFTYPLIGNYGIPEIKKKNEIESNFESSKIHLKAIVISEYSTNNSHYTSVKSLNEWMKKEKIPGITGIDTRALTKKLREKGVMLGKIIVNEQDLDIVDQSDVNFVETVSNFNETKLYKKGKKKIILVDCGCKNNIILSFLKRDITVLRVPWNYNFLDEEYDGVFLSNGPGDPVKCTKTVSHVRELLKQEKPIFGICLGNQILSLAAGAKTYKLKYGHRSQNQPCVDTETKRCLITSQNHGYAVDVKSLPNDWKEWFYNANDRTNEGIRHKTKPFMSVQFHPEATPGPTDADYLFDEFVKLL